LERDRKKEWENIIIFYDCLIDDYQWELQPMRNLIDELRLRGFWEKYYPSTSHIALHISEKYFYHESCENPTICIEYLSNENEFLIHYIQGEDEEETKTGIQKVEYTRLFLKVNFKIFIEWLDKK
jgi:hypothetical protein